MTTTGIVFRDASALISARTSRPPMRGRLRSSRIRSGRGVSAYVPSRRRKAMASTPSPTTDRRLTSLLSRSASRVSRTSPGLSSTSRNSAGRPPDSLSIDVLLTIRDGEQESGSLPRTGFHPDIATVSFDDLLAYGKADPGARIVLLAVQALKNNKYAIEILRRNADAIVAHRQLPGLVRAAGADMDVGRLARLAELDAIADQVLHKLRQLGRVAHERRQGIVADHGAAVVNGDLQVG